MKLSNVPFNMLRTDDAWLTSAIGIPGRIVAINSRPSGIEFETWLDIEWTNGQTSQPRWPEQCVNITVDESRQQPICNEYVDLQVSLLRDHLEYYLRHSAGK